MSKFCTAWITVFLMFSCLPNLNAQDIDIIWKKSYDTEEDVRAARHLEIASDGDLLVSSSSNSENSKIYLSKISAVTGEIRWQIELGGEEMQILHGVMREHAPGVYRVDAQRRVIDNLFSPYAPFIVDINAEGDIISSNFDTQFGNWMERSNIMQYEEGRGYRVVSPEINSRPANIGVRTLDETANFLQNSEVGTMAADSSLLLLYSEIQKDDAIVVAGQINKTGQRNSVTLTKIDLAGNMVWDRRFELGIDCWTRALFQAKNGDLLLAANVYRENKDTLYAALLRLSADGDILWERYFAVDELQNIHSIIETSKSTIVLVGSAGFYGSSGRVLEETSTQALIIHIGSDGRLLWQDTFGSPGAGDVLLAVLELPNGTFALGGLTNNDEMLLSEADIYRTTSVIDDVFASESSNVVPHPVGNQNAQLMFKLKKHAKTILEILDLNGKKVSVSNLGILAEGVQTVELPTMRLAAGVYQYLLKAGSHNIQGKFIRTAD